MHKGRGGRRLMPMELTASCVPPWSIPFYQKPLPFLFLYAGFPIVGPVGAGYIAGTVDRTRPAIGWDFAWVEPVTGFAFRTSWEQVTNIGSPGVTLNYGVTHPATGTSLTGQTVMLPVNYYWDFIGTAGPSYSFGVPALAFGLFVGAGQQFVVKAASWHEMPI